MEKCYHPVQSSKVSPSIFLAVAFAAVKQSTGPQQTGFLRLETGCLRHRFYWAWEEKSTHTCCRVAWLKSLHGRSAIF